MAILTRSKALFIFINLSVVILSSFSVVGNEDSGIVSWALSPHSPALTPAPAPKPHHHHHHNHHAPSHAPSPAAVAPTPLSSPPKPTPPTKSPAAPPPTHHHHHHNASHAKPPAPTHTPTPTPTPTPAPHVKPKPPSAPASPPLQRKAIAVRGLVYCKSCKYRGVDVLDKATPIQGAVVKLACNNTKWHLVEKAKTDKNGFFLIMPKMVTSVGFHKCKVFLVSSPNQNCSVFTNYKLGQIGAPLIPTPPPPELKSPPYDLYTVGPFAFEPSKNATCPKTSLDEVDLNM